jgi:hypothetical protein
MGDRFLQLVIHDATQHPPAHLPNAYSVKLVEEEFSEVRIAPVLKTSFAKTRIGSGS